MKVPDAGRNLVPDGPQTEKVRFPNWVCVFSVVTVIETGTETAFFLLNRTEPKPRFYASVLTVRF